MKILKVIKKRSDSILDKLNLYFNFRFFMACTSEQTQFKNDAVKEMNNDINDNSCKNYFNSLNNKTL